MRRVCIIYLREIEKWFRTHLGLSENDDTKMHSKRSERFSPSVYQIYLKFLKQCSSVKSNINKN